jgi:hypothetical protein
MDPDPGDPKTCGSGGSGSGFGSATLVELVALAGIEVAPFLEDLRSPKVPSSNLPSTTYRTIFFFKL